MKHLCYILILAFGLLAFDGCISSSKITHPVKATIEQTTGNAAVTISKASPKEAVHEVIENTSHILIVSGILAVMAGAALIYFGRVLLGINFIIGGIVVPIAAIWLLHYYVWVILGTIAVLIGTHWTVIKPIILPLFNAAKSEVEKVEGSKTPVATTPVSGSEAVKV